MTISASTRIRYLQPAVHGGVDAAELLQFGIDPAQVVDFSANQSPLGASPLVAPALAAATLDAYPDRDARPLAAAIAAHHGVDAEQVLVGNGSTELIRLIAQLALRPGDVTLAVAPTFGEYAVATELAGAAYETFLLTPDDEFRIDIGALGTELIRLRPAICWWCAPNNPTGSICAPDCLARLVQTLSGTLFVFDEAYCDLLAAPQWTANLLASDNLMVLRSMTKAWGMAGLRLGYALGSAALMRPLRAAKPPWNVNACAQAAGLAALADQQHYARTLDLLRQEKSVLVNGLRAQGWMVLPSAASFFLVHVGDAAQVKNALLPHNCLVRDCASFGLPEYIRISPRLPEQNQRLLDAFATLTPLEKA